MLSGGQTGCCRASGCVIIKGSGCNSDDKKKVAIVCLCVCVVVYVTMSVLESVSVYVLKSLWVYTSSR